MRVLINGEEHQLPESVTLSELLRDLALQPSGIAIEVNEEVVPRDAYGARRLASGDRIEIVHFVGGG